MAHGCGRLPRTLRSRRRLHRLRVWLPGQQAGEGEGVQTLRAAPLGGLQRGRHTRLRVLGESASRPAASIAAAACLATPAAATTSLATIATAAAAAFSVAASAVAAPLSTSVVAATAAAARPPCWRRPPLPLLAGLGGRRRRRQLCLCAEWREEPVLHTVGREPVPLLVLVKEDLDVHPARPRHHARVAAERLDSKLALRSPDTPFDQPRRE
mmetsp:Transcript_45800/g.147492  ORF Transcript_45800/g.147492 Transcript_45800/m.147492 type:complete len:212 (-) Transcript_45800:99-734(-)